MPSAYTRAVEEGMEKGIERGIQNIILNMLKNKFDISTIIKVTGVAEAKILQLQRQLQST